MFPEHPIVTRFQTEFRRQAVGVAVVLLSLLATPVLAQDSTCGSIQNAYGPYDYRTTKGETLTRVETAHFTAPVEALLKGNAGYLGGDLDYTLRAFPNHPRALMAVMRYGEKTKSPKPSDLPRPVECYFTRALQFKPDDTTARLIYATYLGKNGRQTEAVQHTDIAAGYATDNAFTHYNVGLVYFDLKQYDKSLAQAHIAEEQGFPETGLREQLKAAGKWRDAPPRPAPSTEPPAQAASPGALPASAPTTP